MRGEALGVVEGRRRVDETTEAGQQSTAGRGQTVVGQRPVVATVSQGEPGLQHRFHLNGPGAVGMVVSKVLAAPEQVRQTRLVQRVVEAPIGRPPVADEHAVEVGPQDGAGVVEPAAGADGVDGGVRGGEHPQPVALAADAPAGFVRGDDGRVADLLAQRRVGRRGVAGRAMQHLRQAACSGGRSHAAGARCGVAGVRSRVVGPCRHPRPASAPGTAVSPASVATVPDHHSERARRAHTSYAILVKYSTSVKL